MGIIYMKGITTVAISHFANAVPMVGDFVIMGEMKVVVTEVIWHLDNPTWVEVQVDKKGAR